MNSRHFRKEYMSNMIVCMGCLSDNCSFFKVTGTRDCKKKNHMPQKTSTKNKKIRKSKQSDVLTQTQVTCISPSF